MPAKEMMGVPGAESQRMEDVMEEVKGIGAERAQRVFRDGEIMVWEENGGQPTVNGLVALDSETALSLYSQPWGEESRVSLAVISVNRTTGEVYGGTDPTGTSLKVRDAAAAKKVLGNVRAEIGALNLQAALRKAEEILSLSE